MRNYKGFFKSYKLGLTAVVLAASLIASPSLYSGPFDDESISVSETADTSTVSNTDSIKITITDTKTAEEAGINEIQEGYPINGVVVANTLRLRSWPWGEVTAKYHKGQSLKVLGESGEFYLVEIDGRQGYMHHRQSISLICCSYISWRYQIRRIRSVKRRCTGFKNR